MEKYAKAQMEVIEFEAEDVITTSGCNGMDVLGVFHPFAPDAQQAARCQVLDNFFHK